MYQRRQVSQYEVLTAFVCAAGLYLPFVSRQFDLNGIDEALALDADALWLPNHLFYRPVGLLLKELLAFFGFRISTIFVLQYLTAACSAVALVCAYLLFRRIGAQRFVAGTAAFALGTSWSWWAFGTDAMYVPLASVFVLLSLIAFVDGRNCGYWLGFAILVWEADVLLIPAFVLGFVLLHRAPFRAQIRRLLGFLLACSLPVASLYFIAAASVAIGTPREFLAWISTHGKGPGLPMWGRAEWGRLLIAIKSAALSIDSDGTIGVIVFCAIGIAATCACIHWLRRSETAKVRTLVWLGAAYLIFIPFITWWDPAEAKWFVIPNIFLAAFAVHAVGGLQDRRYSGLILFTISGLISASNFVSTIWPRRFTANHNLELAACVASRMTTSDLFLSMDWDWGGYLRYFYGRQEIGFIAEAAFFGKPETTVRKIRARVGEVQSGDGEVYVMDVGEYPDWYLPWLQQQTGLTRRQLRQFEGEPAFRCGTRTIRRVPMLIPPRRKYVAADRSEIPLTSQTGTSLMSAGGGAKMRIGYADWNGPAGGFAILDFRSAGVLQSASAVPVSPDIISGRFLVETGDGQNAGLALTNPTDRTAHIEFWFVNSAGSRGSGGSLDVAPHAQISAYLTDRPFLAPRTYGGTFTFRSTTPIAVVAYETRADTDVPFQFSRIRVVDMAETARPEVLPLRNGVSLMNFGNEVEKGCISFLGLSSPGEIDYAIPAQGTFKIPPSSFLPEYGFIKPAPHSVLPKISVDGLHQAIASNLYIEQLDAGDEYGESISTQVVIANTSNTSNTIQLTLQDLVGNKMGPPWSATLQPNQLWVTTFGDSEQTASLPASFQGILKLEAAGTPVAATSIMRRERRNMKPIVTYLPALEAYPAGENRIVVPEIVDGGGYTTQFVLFNAGTEPASAVLRYFSALGKPLSLPITR